MSSSSYPKTTRELTEKRQSFDADIEVVFQVFGRAVFADGVLSSKAKQLIAWRSSSAWIRVVGQCTRLGRGQPIEAPYLSR